MSFAVVEGMHLIKDVDVDVVICQLSLLVKLIVA